MSLWQASSLSKRPLKDTEPTPLVKSPMAVVNYLRFLPDQKTPSSV